MTSTLIPKTEQNTVAIFYILMALMAFSSLSPMNAIASYVVITDTFEAGTAGNGAVFKVRNNTNQVLNGVKMTPQFPLQYSTITSIKPETTKLEPGESVDFTIEFSVYEDAPDGAQDSITLFFENNEGIKIDNPRFQINIDIAGADKKRKHNTAYFKVLVQGAGYTFTYGAGTYRVSGSEERYLVVHRDQSALEKLEEMKKAIDGDPCERTWPSYVEGEVGAPRLFTSGAQLTIIDGPYYDYDEFFGGLVLKKSWHIDSKEGPSPREMAERVCR